MSPSDPDVAVATEASVIPPGHLGHGLMAVVRRHPPRPGNGRPDGVGGLFELICSDCGDHLYLDYSEVPARLQRLRGPRDIRSALAAYHRHLGLAI